MSPSRARLLVETGNESKSLISCFRLQGLGEKKQNWKTLERSLMKQQVPGVMRTVGKGRRVQMGNMVEKESRELSYSLNMADKSQL